MRTKRWPDELAKTDPDPEEMEDPCPEVKRLVVHGDHVYFFLWCWDMAWSMGPQVSVLFRAPLSFDADAERVASIQTEMVDLTSYDGSLYALENGADSDGGFGAVHRLSVDGAAAAQTVRFKMGKVYKALGHGADGSLHAAGSAIFTFDGKTWRARPTPREGLVHAVASGGGQTVAVGADGLLLTLNGHEPRLVARSGDRADGDGVHVDGDGIVSIAGDGAPLQGPLDRLAPLDAPSATFNDCALFQGKRYWSAAGDEGVGGLYVQNGRALELVFEEGSCFQLTATDRYLFAATDEGVLRYDGEAWKKLFFLYDDDAKVWRVVVTPPSDEDGDGEDGDDEDDGEDEDDGDDE